MGVLYAGASGFAYASWKPEFYPPELPEKDFLRYYAGRLNAVEINYTFRRLPSASTLSSWVNATPESFRFAVKAHQRITHIQRLKRAEFTRVFFEAIDGLRVMRRLGPVLFQTPPNLKCDLDLLAGFLEDVPADVRCAFEFRHASWFQQDVYRLLEARGAALCLAEHDDFVTPEVITGGFLYCRLRKSAYAREDLAAIQEKVRRQLRSGKDVYVFFKHEETPAGALYAEQLLQNEAAAG